MRLLVVYCLTNHPEHSSFHRKRLDDTLKPLRPVIIPYHVHKGRSILPVAWIPAGRLPVQDGTEYISRLVFRILRGHLKPFPLTEGNLHTLPYIARLHPVKQVYFPDANQNE